MKSLLHDMLLQEGEWEREEGGEEEVGDDEKDEE